jgi:hypothetical protein
VVPEETEWEDMAWAASVGLISVPNCIIVV